MAITDSFVINVSALALTGHSSYQNHMDIFLFMCRRFRAWNTKC